MEAALRRCYKHSVAAALAALWQQHCNAHGLLQVGSLTELLMGAHELAAVWPGRAAVATEAKAVCAAAADGRLPAEAVLQYLSQSAAHRQQLADSWPLPRPGRCPQGHDLRGFKVGTGPGKSARDVHWCAICGKALLHTVARCVSCRYDLCAACAPGANSRSAALLVSALLDSGGGAAVAVAEAVSAGPLYGWPFVARTVAVHPPRATPQHATALTAVGDGSTLRKWQRRSYAALSQSAAQWSAVAATLNSYMRQQTELRPHAEVDAADELCSQHVAACSEGTDGHEMGGVVAVWAACRQQGDADDLLRLLLRFYTGEGPDVDRLLGFVDSPAPWQPAAVADWAAYRREKSGRRNKAVWEQVDAMAADVCAAASPQQSAAALRDLSAAWGRSLALLAHAAAPVGQLWRRVADVSADDIAGQLRGLARRGLDLWADAGGDESAVLFSIADGCGVAAADAAMYPDEAAVLLPPMALLRIERVVAAAGGPLTVHCRYSSCLIDSDVLVAAGASARRAARRLDGLAAAAPSSVARLQLVQLPGADWRQSTSAAAALRTALCSGSVPAVARSWLTPASSVLCGLDELVNHEASRRLAAVGTERLARKLLLPALEAAGRRLAEVQRAAGLTLVAHRPGCACIESEEGGGRVVVQRNVRQGLRKAVLQAASDGRTRDAVQLAERGYFDAQIRGAGKANALHLAAANPSFWNDDGVRALLVLAAAGPAALEVRNADGRTPLHLAAAAGAPGAVLRAVGSTDAAATADSDGCTPLHLACRAQTSQVFPDAEALAALVADGRPLSARDAAESTPLHVAVASASSSWAEALLDAGADECAQDADGRTAAHVAAATEECAAGPRRLSMQLMGRINSPAALRRRDSLGRTPLQASIRRRGSRLSGSAAIAWHRGFASSGSGAALVSAKGDGGDTLLHSACATADDDALRELLAAGAKATAKGSGGQTALHVAAASAFVDGVRRLASTTAALRMRDFDGRTPLHHAAASGSPACVMELLAAAAAAGPDAEAALFAQDFGGRTALHVAVMQPTFSRRVGGGTDALRAMAAAAGPLAATVDNGSETAVDTARRAGLLTAARAVWQYVKELPQASPALSPRQHLRAAALAHVPDSPSAAREFTSLVRAAVAEVNSSSSLNSSPKSSPSPLRGVSLRSVRSLSQSCS
eukprot:TRINITY_DN24776_c0_g1_i1.p1 TRINITY_DN24776_c0_g1~~TRINITY_DN24776_c0_g1_i1.p1  ORF type:complete len:1273 (+),score=490.16 TRINITY_DN24776_c0_g1_i1:313-3819(+)